MMRDSLSERVKKIPPSGIRKFFDLVLGMPDVISLGVGEPDFSTPWHISERAIYGIENGYTSYTSNRGLKELRQLISDDIFARANVRYDPENQILITVGVSEALDLSIRAILNPSERVLIIRPAYVSYAPVVSLCGGEPVFIDLTPETGFKLTPAILKDALKKYYPVKAVIFNYPCNPTGVSYTEEQLKEIVDVFAEFGVIVISDEIYDGLSYDFPHTPLVSFPEIRDNLIYLNGFSKIYAMTGWRIGYAVGPQDIISLMTKIHQYTALCAPIMSQMAAIEAIENGKQDIENMRREYKRRRNLTVSELNRLNLRTNLPQGAFYVYVDISVTKLDSMKFAEGLLMEEKVAVVPGVAFSPYGDKFIRISYSTSMQNIKEAIKRMEVFLGKVCK